MSANVEETEMTTQTDAANSGQTVLVHAEIGADGALRPVVAELLGDGGHRRVGLVQLGERSVGARPRVGAPVRRRGRRGRPW